jgi:hypothetical protein
VNVIFLMSETNISLQVLPDVRSLSESESILKQILERVHHNVNCYSSGLPPESFYKVKVDETGNVIVKFPANYLVSKIKNLLRNKSQCLHKFDHLCQTYNWTIKDFYFEPFFKRQSFIILAGLFIASLILSIVLFKLSSTSSVTGGLGILFSTITLVLFIFTVMYALNQTYFLFVSVQYKGESIPSVTTDQEHSEFDHVSL